jgi:hypothetical protein
MNPYNKKINYASIEDSKKLQRLLALNGIDSSNTSKALNRSEMMRLFRITPANNKLKGFFDIEEFMNPLV